jgi:hypothetical protein
VRHGFDLEVSFPARAGADAVESTLVGTGRLELRAVVAPEWRSAAAAGAKVPDLVAACATAHQGVVPPPRIAPFAKRAPSIERPEVDVVTCLGLGADPVDGAALTDAAAQQSAAGTWVVGVHALPASVAAVDRLMNACYVDAPDICPPTGVGQTGSRGRVAVLLDGEVLSAPTVDQRDLAQNPGGFQIEGGFTEQSASQLAVWLDAGHLPYTFQPPVWSTMSRR